MKALRHTRHCFDDQTVSLIAHTLTSSRFDYANSVLLGSPHYVINKFQHSQNFLAIIFLQSGLPSPLEVSLTASLATCPNQNSFQACHYYIQSPFYQLPAIPCFTNPLLSTCPFSSLLWPELSPADFIQHQLWFSLIPLLCSCHLELNSSQNPLNANHWCLQTQLENILLLPPSRPCHLLPVHQIQFILTLLHVNIDLHLYFTFSGTSKSAAIYRKYKH